MVRHNNQLPNNLPQLQNLIKRDPTSYKEEFLQQKRHFESTLEVFSLNPGHYNKSLDELVMFLAQVAYCYPEDLSSYPQQLVDLLQKHNTVLDNDMRMTFCRALILLRNKNLLTPTDLLSLFFKLLQCQDKNLRKFLSTHIVTDIKSVNSKNKNVRLNTTLQNFMYSMLNKSNRKAAKMSVDIMIELYKKNVWNDTKTVNVISTGCFSKNIKVMVACLQFFLGSDIEEKNSDDSDSDNEPNAKEVIMANKVNKKTRKREHQLKKVKKLVIKSKKKKSKGPVYNFSALHLIHDPQGFAEKLFKKLQSTVIEKFEVKILILDVISRLIGLHNLILLNYYPYIQRFIQPHQREVTKLLQFAAQASHEFVPPDVLEPLIKTIVNNFVTERNSSDVMAIGLNAVKEMCVRCPFVMNEDLLRDLTQYKHYRDRSVMMAAKSLITLFKTTAPELLHKKDRGRPTEASVELKLKQFGETDVKDYIPGAEALLKESDEELQINSDSDSDDEDQWIDIKHSSDEDNTGSKSDSNCSDEEEEEEDDDVEEEEEEIINETNTSIENKIIKKDKILKAKPFKNNSESSEIKKSKKELSKDIISTRILTDEDFKKIELLNLRKQTQAAKKGTKRKIETENKSELVKLSDIEMIYKKRKHSKEDRMKSVREGQADREKYGYKDGRLNENCSKTNREKRKTKNYQMIKHKARGKVKRSFKDKQISLRNYLLKQKRMK